VIKVFLVDDHDLVRAGIRTMLETVSGITVIGETSSGEAAVKEIRELTPDVVIMDIKMPGIGGVEATRKIRRMDPDIKILVLTVYNDDIFPSRLLEAGASGYMTKGATLQEMVQAIRAVHVGQRYISPNIARQLAFKNLKEVDKSPFEALSERELQVAFMLIQGVRSQDIAKELGVSSKTVNSYRYRIFEKLELKNDVELALLAIKYGMLDSEEDASKSSA